MLENKTFTIVDEGKIEMLVNADYDISDSQIEECHGIHEVGGGVDVNIVSVELLIKGLAIPLTDQLNRTQLSYLESEVINQIDVPV